MEGEAADVDGGDKADGPSRIVHMFGKAGELALGIAGLAVGTMLGLAGFLSSDSPPVALQSAIFCAGILGLSVYAGIQTWVMRRCVTDAQRAFERYHDVVEQFGRHKRGIHESDKIFRQLQERRAQLDRYFLEISKYRFVKNANASKEIIDYLIDICDYCNKALSMRNGLPTESFSTNIKTIYWKNGEPCYDTLVRCTNTPDERRNNPNTQFKVKSHAVFDKMLHDYRRRHIIRNLSDYLKEKRPNIGNGSYTGPSSNALKYYGSSICVAIFDQSPLISDEKNEPVFKIVSDIEESTSILTHDGCRVFGFLLVDTNKMIFNYESDDVSILRELAIPVKSAIKLLQAIQSGNSISH